MKGLGAVVLIAAMSGSTTLRDSHASFKQALAACSGALGSVTFALGHARVAAAPGVDSDESFGDAGKVNVVLQDGGSSKAAKLSIDQSKRTISAKNVRVEAHGTIACILPD
ncbi:MAG: hypothetical protein JO359_08900 [Candidatus Eremiobacteraeota bacterium]|nr:hypothetical protein [Candidatus Eremiobacteraeota bacterium]